MAKGEIFVINLKKSKDRLAYISKRLTELGITFHRIEGVAADILPSSKLLENYSADKNRKMYVRPLHKGQIACYLAHINAWREILNRKLDFAVILEDDVIIHDNLPSAFEFLNNTFGKWDFVRLEDNSKPKKIFYEKSLGKFSFVTYINTSGGARSTAISSSAAKKMLDELIPFGVPVDVQQQYLYKIGVKLTSLRPPLTSNGKIGEDSILRKYEHGNKRHYPLVRQKLSIEFYFGRLLRLRSEFGTFSFLKSILSMPFRKYIR